MILPLEEPLFAKYIYVSDENIVHVFMPIVSGTTIGLDNTCKAVFALQEFFNKGSDSKATIEGGLLAYAEALERDISLLDASSELAQQKKERLAQIDAYYDALLFMLPHAELDSLKTMFPSYPRPLEGMMQDRTTSNLYSMVLRPGQQDPYLRSEGANPIFSVAHSSVTRELENTKSTLQVALITAYSPLTFKTDDLHAEITDKVLEQLKSLNETFNFDRLRDILATTVQTELGVTIDFTKTPKGVLVTQHYIDDIFLGENSTPAQYINDLFNLCAPDLLTTVPVSPFKYLTQAEGWSIATQFLLGLSNIHAVAQDKTQKSTNFGGILDKRSDLSADLAQTLATAQQAKADIDEACLLWINTHATELGLKIPFTTNDIKTIKQDFANKYIQIKESPHFDEFFVLDTQKEGGFVIHQGAICTSFAKFLSSPLFDMSQELTKPLENASSQASSLGVNIPHKNPLVQGEVAIDTTAMDNTALQALYERIIKTYKDPKLKKSLLVQLKQERPDFNPEIDARQFLLHVAYGQQNEAESLLKNDAELAQELLTARNTAFTDYSGRTFKCTAYEYAYWAKDTHMCEMLNWYMDDHTKSTILRQVQRIEELTGDGLFQKNRGLVYSQNGKEYCSAHFDLAPLKRALSTYIEASNQSPNITDADREEQATLWLKIGLLQREVPAHIAQEYCDPQRSFKEVVENPTLLDAANPANLERWPQFQNLDIFTRDHWFKPKSEDSRLGFSFAITRGAGEQNLSRRREGALGDRSPGNVRDVRIDLSAIEAIDKVRTEDLKQSLASLVAPEILQTHQLHGS